MESVDEYRFVECLLPPTSIPKPPKHEHYPTPRGLPPNLPYFKEVEDFLSPLLGKTPITQVNEVTGTLRVKGYFDQQLKAWLLEKGF
ncbi:hypothetical protein EI555_020884 [Monodon monoceros]|uniref:Large ribosomal subunit protein mL49 n=1 Tax=Monodon monoceros TaxID=40151 RepID=A0A4U1FES9_MONMO|nr:hypothetical protein EI555_020884 [Monodon monoceros]